MPDLFLEIHDRDGEPERSPEPLPEEDALVLLACSEFTATKLIPWGSNYSFAVALEAPDGSEQLAIYKPRAGEAPLHDFRDGTLYLRETAAYLLSREMQWHIVPPTIVRDGPHGVGSVQLYIQPDETMADPRDFWGAATLEIERLVLFDHIANNADRKLTHCLLDTRGKVWGIDHGLTFNVAPKLRTVLWQFTEQPIAASLQEDLRRALANWDSLAQKLQPLLTQAEIEALSRRIVGLLDLGCYPRLNPYRNIPYGWW